jgi:Zn-dependent protease with chaperone function
MRDLGRSLMLFGAVLFCVGVALTYIKGWSWLPGDIVVERKNFTFVFPIVTCLVVSVLLTLLARFFGR